ncbi:MAG: hypothetical protein ACE14M_07585 [Terriglobales bacterium]
MVTCFAEIIDAKNGLLSIEPKLRSWIFGVVDLSTAKSADYSSDELRAIATVDEALSSITRSDATIAIVAPGDLQFGLARMWQAFAHAITWETMHGV